MNGSTCVDGPCTYAACLFQWSCVCADGWAGAVCEVNLDECASYPCANGGTCVDAIFAYSCVCAAGYRGACKDTVGDVRSISKYLPLTEAMTCLQARTSSKFGCSFSLALYGHPGKIIQDFCKLTCLGKFCTGRGNCDKDIDECLSTPCMNGSTCSDSRAGSAIAADRYVCTCAAGYSGAICETDLNECASTPCLHGATCTQGVNSYTCTCAAGYSDVPVGTCYSELDECSSAPCLNSGTCFDHTFAYSCVCSDGYSGFNCEVNPDECGSSPCMNGSTCTDMIDAFECTCAEGWSGGICELEVDPCPKGSNDCDGLRAECIFVGAGKHECVCHPGYKTKDGGKTCTSIEECYSWPCQNGSTCVDGPCTYAACLFQWSCVCVQGWAGTTCEIDLDELRPIRALVAEPACTVCSRMLAFATLATMASTVQMT